MKQTKLGLLALLITLVLTASSARATVYKVKPGGAGVGTTWPAAGNLQATLAVAGAGDTVQVAEGTYALDPTNPFDTYVLNGETVRGGYRTFGPFGAIRNPERYATILAGNGVAEHVVTLRAGTLDGCHVTGGVSGLLGGGVYVIGDGPYVIDQCRIYDNFAVYGGGVCYYPTIAGTTLEIEDTWIYDNHALAFGGVAGHGGGVYTHSAEVIGTLKINRCSVLGNSATGWGGGVYSNFPADITNTVFSGNDAGFEGGGVWADWARFVWNCTLANNSSDSPIGGGGAYLPGAWLANSILWGNTATGGSTLDMQVIHDGTLNAWYCDTEGGMLPGPGNRSSAPLFVGETGTDGLPGTPDDDLHLQSSSPCRDAGFNALAANPLDRDSTTRIRMSKSIGGSLTVDIGAYEHSTTVSVIPAEIRSLRPARAR